MPLPGKKGATRKPFRGRAPCPPEAVFRPLLVAQESHLSQLLRQAGLPSREAVSQMRNRAGNWKICMEPISKSYYFSASG